MLPRTTNAASGRLRNERKLHQTRRLDAPEQIVRGGTGHPYLHQRPGPEPFTFDDHPTIDFEGRTGSACRVTFRATLAPRRATDRRWPVDHHGESLADHARQALARDAVLYR